MARGSKQLIDRWPGPLRPETRAREQIICSIDDLLGDGESLNCCEMEWIEWRLYEGAFLNSAQVVFTPPLIQDTSYLMSKPMHILARLPQTARLKWR